MFYKRHICVFQAIPLPSQELNHSTDLMKFPPSIWFGLADWTPSWMSPKSFLILNRQSDLFITCRRILRYRAKELQRFIWDQMVLNCANDLFIAFWSRESDDCAKGLDIQLVRVSVLIRKSNNIVMLFCSFITVSSTIPVVTALSTAQTLLILFFWSVRVKTDRVGLLYIHTVVHCWSPTTLCQ